MTIKDIFDFHAKDTIYIEEWCNGRKIADHFCFGYRNKEKGLITLNREGAGTPTLIDGFQKAFVDSTNPEFMFAKDTNGAEIKIKFIKKVAHRFQIGK